jgi:hypothetical protein
MGFAPAAQISSQDVLRTSTTKLMQLGQVGVTRDGKTYRYAYSGAVALVAGKLTTAKAKVANHTNQAVAAAGAVGDRTVSVTLGATAATAEQYTDGYIQFLESAGMGQSLQIASSPVIASAGTGVLQLADALATAVTTSSKYSLVYNPWDGTIISASAVALFANGVPNVAVAINNYYWSQVGGIANVLSDGVIGKASGAIISDAVDGAVEVEVAGTVTQRVGWALEATVDTKYYPLMLNASALGGV